MPMRLTTVLSILSPGHRGRRRPKAQAIERTSLVMVCWLCTKIQTSLNGVAIPCSFRVLAGILSKEAYSQGPTLRDTRLEAFRTEWDASA
jgi:hypothetical protein